MPKLRGYVDPSDFRSVIDEGHTIDNGVTASAVQTLAGGFPVTKTITRVTTVASAGNAVTLPLATEGDRRVIINRGANAISVFPGISTQNINALSNGAAYTLAADGVVEFICAKYGTWDTLEGVGGTTDELLVVMGQSNAMAYGPTSVPSEVAAIDSSRVKIWNGSAFVGYIAGTNSEPTGIYPTKWGPEAPYAIRWLVNHPTGNLYIVKRAVDASAIASWQSGQTNFNNATAWVNGANVVLAGTPIAERNLLWLQGESDANVDQTKADAYAAGLTSFLASARSEWGVGKIAVMRVHNTNMAYRATVRAAQNDICWADDRSFIINTDDLTLVDTYHYDATGVVAIGDRMYTAIRRGAEATLGSVYANGENGFLAGNFSDPGLIFTTQAGPTNVAADADPVGRVVDSHSPTVFNNAITIDALRPVWKNVGGKQYLLFAGAQSLIAPVVPVGAGVWAVAFKSTGGSAPIVMSAGTTTGNKRLRIGLTATNTPKIVYNTAIDIILSANSYLDAITIVVFTWDATGYAAYLNGDLVASGSTAPNFDGSGAGLTLGTYELGGALYFTGSLPAALAADRRATPDEMLMIYNRFKNLF